MENTSLLIQSLDPYVKTIINESHLQNLYTQLYQNRN